MAVENYNSHLLINPSSKKRSCFKRNYPFPVVTSDCLDDQPDLNWKCVEGELQDDGVLVKDDKNIVLLYTMGYYGKGTLSKNAPAVCLKNRTKSSKRQKFSQAGPSTDSDPEEIINLVDSDEETKSKDTNVPTQTDVIVSESDSDSIESEIDVLGDSEKENLHLTFEEAYFLSYGLGCLVVIEKNQPFNLARLWNKFCELTPDEKFPIMYTAYHHFRSKGWVVKNGLKFGVDYVLYKDGPPFYHATYAVIVKPVKEKQMREFRGSKRLTWSSLSALNRINTTAGKALMFLYVIKPESISDNKIATPYCLSQYKLEEVIVKRWVPSENREETAQD